MKSTEPAKFESAPGLVREAVDFWARNVNVECIMERSVREHERGPETYFAELETQRYRSHRYLPGWIASMWPGSRVLEVGSGIGLDSARMTLHGLHVTAVDLTVAGIVTASLRVQKQHFDAAYLSSDAKQLPFPDATFDYVYSFGVMHHAPDTRRCVDEAWQVLRPGQALIMLYHRHLLNKFVHRMLRVSIEKRDELCPKVRCYTVSGIHAMFSRFAKVECALISCLAKVMARCFAGRLSPHVAGCRVGWSGIS